jgi:holo-[acyl-carrier protein] synthase
MIVAIGLDVVDVARVERMLEENRDRVLARLFTNAKSAYALARPHPAQHLAVRLAAKEAAFKALAGSALARAVGWRDIEVRNDADGVPSLALSGRAQARLEELGATMSHVSLSHSDATAVAVVVLERESR